MKTSARVASDGNSHYYTVEGEPKHEVIGKSTGKPRPTNISDARSLNLLPSVTTILKTLDKPGLNEWRIEQALLAALTTPRNKDEEVDAFIHRVLHVEKIQDQERQSAADRGTAIHAAIESYFGEAEFGSEEFRPGPVDAEIWPWIKPAVEHVLNLGKVHDSELIVVGPGYAGRTDLWLDCNEFWGLLDFKGTKSIPKGAAWPEHRLQLSAYANALPVPDKKKPIICSNLYISTVTQGEFVMLEHEDWRGTYEHGFKPLVGYWQWANQHFPSQASVADEKTEAGLVEFDRLAEELQETVKPETKLGQLPQELENFIERDKAPPAIVKGKKVRWTISSSQQPAQSEPQKKGTE